MRTSPCIFACFGLHFQPQIIRCEPLYLSLVAKICNPRACSETYTREPSNLASAGQDGQKEKDKGLGFGGVTSKGMVVGCKLAIDGVLQLAQVRICLIVLVLEFICLSVCE